MLDEPNANLEAKLKKSVAKKLDFEQHDQSAEDAEKTNVLVQEIKEQTIKDENLEEDLEMIHLRFQDLKITNKDKRRIDFFWNSLS